MNKSLRKIKRNGMPSVKSAITARSFSKVKSTTDMYDI